MKPSTLGNLATYRPRTNAPGRPSKRLPQVIVLFLKLLSAGESRRRAAKFIRVSPKTIQRWLREDAKFRKSVQKAEQAGKPQSLYLRWLNHPFRGRRPPLKASATSPLHRRNSAVDPFISAFLDPSPRTHTRARAAAHAREKPTAKSTISETKAQKQNARRLVGKRAL